MCGIVGYVGSEESAPILVAGLRRLEYRGYDSAGVATLDRHPEAALPELEVEVVGPAPVVEVAVRVRDPTHPVQVLEPRLEDLHQPGATGPRSRIRPGAGR